MGNGLSTRTHDPEGRVQDINLITFVLDDIRERTSPDKVVHIDVEDQLAGGHADVNKGLLDIFSDTEIVHRLMQYVRSGEFDSFGVHGDRTEALVRYIEDGRSQPLPYEIRVSLGYYIYYILGEYRKKVFGGYVASLT